MKINPHILKFPKVLPNDEQQFMTYYPYKYPKVVEYFEEKAAKLYNDPVAYTNFVHEEFETLKKEVLAIQEEYNNGNKEDLSFLVHVDQKFNKVFCFKFWIINYVFADGPIHEFYVDNLKALARKLVDVVDDIEEYEQRVIRLQRDLLQTDYADIYLAQALHGVTVAEFLLQDEFSKKIVEKIVPLLDEHDDKNNDRISEMWQPIIKRMIDDSDDHYQALKEDPSGSKTYTLLDLAPLVLPITQVKMRGTNFPLISFLNHTMEFREENIALRERYESMKATIADIFAEAKEKLDAEEYADFELAYEMAKNFSSSKDYMGNIDPIIIPVWTDDLHERVYHILSKTQTVRYLEAHHAAMFCSFIWYLPDELKAQVLSVDNTIFN